MCGIGLIVVSESHTRDQEATQIASRLHHRGPNVQSCVPITDRCSIVSCRLPIFDIEGPSQPFVLTTPDRRFHLVVNGEIYNHLQLKQKYAVDSSSFSSASDCEVILLLYRTAWHEDDAQFFPRFQQLLAEVDGEFAFIVVESTPLLPSAPFVRIVAARDPLGVKPLIYAANPGGALQLASELQAIHPSFHSIASDVPPGTFISFNGLNMATSIPSSVIQPFYLPTWRHSIFNDPAQDGAGGGRKGEGAPSIINATLASAVEKRLMTDHPKIGCFLSGGVDSSIVAALAAHLIRTKYPDKTLFTFTVRYQASHATAADPSIDPPDHVFAARVAEAIQSQHAEYCFTLADALEVLPLVIRHLETTDLIQIRAAVPLYLLSRFASKSFGIKVVLVGEGADEVFAGYRLFESYPPDRSADFERELQLRLWHIGHAELLRVDRMTMAHSIEARVPFLDVSFLESAMSIDPALKMNHPAMGRIEKYLLRASFLGLLPHDILFRKKVSFADGLGPWLVDLRDTIASASGQSEAEYYQSLFLAAFHSEEPLQLVHRRNQERKQHRHWQVPPSFSSPSMRGWHPVALDGHLNRLVSHAEAAEFVQQMVGKKIDLAFQSRAALQQIVEGVLCHIPFQNVTLLLREKRPPTPEEIKSDMLQRIGGGCATIASFLGAVLSQLGYEVCLMPATIHQPECHVTLLVQLEGLYYFIDVGNGKPYFEPMALCEAGRLYSHGATTFKLAFDPAAECYRLLHQDKTDPEKFNCAISFDPCKTVHFDFFLPMIYRSRTEVNYGPFLTGLRLCLFRSDGTFTAIRDRILMDGMHRREAVSISQLLDFIDIHFQSIPHLIKYFHQPECMALLSTLLSFPSFTSSIHD